MSSLRVEALLHEHPQVTEAAVVGLRHDRWGEAVTAVVIRATGATVTVTVHGKPSAVLLATEDLESLEETIEILADADAMRRLHASDAELARGDVETQDALAAAMQRRRATT